MTKKLGSILVILVCLAMAPQLWAEATAEEASAAEPTFAAQEGAVECNPAALTLEETLGDSLKNDMAGCTASYNCVHGGTVSCSAPTGTCTSSGQRCGRVTCNGQTTWCPGGCVHSFNCASFCSSQGSSDGFCDQFGCCVCL